MRRSGKEPLKPTEETPVDDYDDVIRTEAEAEEAWSARDEQARG